MPFINVKTNVDAAAKTQDIKTQLGKAISLIPGKSETWLMVEVEDKRQLFFQGSADPAAMVEVSIYGTASSGAMNALTAQITDILGSSLNIPGNRVYVKYTPTQDWGWNGSNF